MDKPNVKDVADNSVKGTDLNPVRPQDVIAALAPDNLKRAPLEGFGENKSPVRMPLRSARNESGPRE